MPEPLDDHADSSFVLEGLHFPECLRWHEGRLFFCDMYGDAVHACDANGDRFETVAEVFHPGGIGWLPDDRMLVVASEDRQILEIGAAGNIVYADLSDVAPGWLNDMLVDDDGRVYVGNFGYDLFAEEPRKTHLAIVDRDRRIRVQTDELMFPNGMGRLSDGRLVVAETFARCLTSFRLDADGELRRAASISVDPSIPDGICVDAEDNVWIASVYEQAVIRVAPDGRTVSRAVSQMAFACALGGADGRTLFVATAPDFEPEQRRAERAGRIEQITVSVPAAAT
jgi:sugar lactone lactonase YvrE